MKAISTDRLVILMLALVSIMLVGMLTTSWRVVLYPYLVVVGVVILLGVGQRRHHDRVLLGLGAGVTLVYLALYLWFDVAMDSELGSNTDLIGGVVPSTAIYFFAIWPFGLVVAALYAILHRRIMTDEVPPTRAARLSDRTTSPSTEDA